MKYAVLLVIIASVIFLALKDPEVPQRDPVPDELIVAHSSHCAGCHGSDSTGLALVDHAGNDINIYDDWKVSMMALSARDPFWRATLKHEVNIYPSAQAEIESTCLKCHAPLGSQQHKYDSLDYAFDEMLGDSLGLDGVSCSACHLQPPETYGRAHSGNITFNTERVLYGPFPAPFQGPMELYVGFKPEYSDLLYSSGVCAGCHTLITGTLDETGMPTGNMFVEQATYHEWLNSSYAQQGKDCQNCHMPSIEDSVFIASGFKGIERRSPFGVHLFYGANTAMLTLMGEYRKELGLSNVDDDEPWSESIESNRMSLQGAAVVAINTFSVIGDTLYLDVSVTNKAGHKLPSGYPSRIAWLQLVMTDDLTGDTLYANGMLDDSGRIVGRDLPFEPHHEIAKSEDDVQIYEMVMSDMHGALTTRLNAAYQPLKDNRLLPAGFKRNHTVYDTVAIWGNAQDDPDYDALSTLGRDNIEYRIPLHGKDGLADLQVSLRYHTFPSRWMQDLFEDEQTPEVSQFKAMYAGYSRFTELIDSVRLDDVDLGFSSVSQNQDDQIFIFPNPTIGRMISIGFASPKVDPSDMKYKIIDVHGAILQSGSLTHEILLNEGTAPGVYYFIVLRKERSVSVQKLMVL